MKDKGCKIKGVVLLSAFFVVGIPIIINELYKREGWYSTVWTGADVLAYYGTLLGAAATILALVVTIRVTQEQVRAERLFQLELERWHNLEKAIDNMLMEMQPLSFPGRLKSIRHRRDTAQIEQWMDNFIIREDGIMVNLSSADQKRIAPCLAMMKRTEDEVYRVVEQSRGYFDYCDYCKSENDYEEKKEQKYREMMEGFYKIHNTLYVRTLDTKRIVFDKIYREIAGQSQKKLSFGRSK